MSARAVWAEWVLSPRWAPSACSVKRSSVYAPASIFLAHSPEGSHRSGCVGFLSAHRCASSGALRFWGCEGGRCRLCLWEGRGAFPRELLHLPAHAPQPLIALPGLQPHGHLHPAPPARDFVKNLRGQYPGESLLPLWQPPCLLQAEIQVSCWGDWDRAARVGREAGIGLNSWHTLSHFPL